MKDACIWQDAHDENICHLGVANRMSETHALWATISIDGLYDLFDLDSAAVKAIGTTPVPIKLEMVLPRDGGEEKI